MIENSYYDISLEDLEHILNLRGIKINDEKTRAGSDDSLFECSYMNGLEYHKVTIYYGKEGFKYLFDHGTDIAVRSITFEQYFQKEMRDLKIKKLLEYDIV